MSRRAKILALALAGVVLLGGGAAVVGTTGIAGTATAQEPTTVYQGSLARVASILGIEEQQLRDAFDQVKAEMCQERLDRAIERAIERQPSLDERAIERQLSLDEQKAYITGILDQAVQEGRISAEQKASILEQWEKRDSSSRHFRKGGGHRSGMFGW